MNFSPHPRSKSTNSFVALLLQPTLHYFVALAPINHLDGITYRRNCQKTRKSNAALLLPHVFAVSPLLHYSYKKMGGGPSRPSSVRSQSVTPSVFYHLRKTSRIPQKDPNVFYHLRTTLRIAAKTPLCFLSLTDHVTRKCLCFLSLTKKAGGVTSDSRCYANRGRMRDRAGFQ